MRMTTVTYTATINLGNYESEKIEITAEIEGDDQSPSTIIETLREHVDKATFAVGWLDRQRKPGPPKVASVRKIETDPFAGLEE